MSFSYGYGSGNFYYKYNNYYVRAVRGGQLIIGSFDPLVINGDRIVSDNTTGLMWQQDTVKTATGRTHMVWKDALSYCENLTLGGYTDWRLPTVKELRSIVDYRVYSPAIDIGVFKDTIDSFYWSNTTNSTNAYGAWSVEFYAGADCGGAGNDRYYPKNHLSYVRAVRGGQSVTPPVSNKPTVQTGDASVGDTNSATLNGTVNPNGTSTTYYFQYGLSTSYGSVTPAADAGSGTTIKTVSANITGLAAATTYHFQLVGTNTAGTVYGGDKTFTTTGENTTEDRYDEGYEAGKKYCEDNPTACGISTGGGYTQADLDAKYKEGYNAGAGSCSNGSSSSPATISAALDLDIPQLNYNTAFGVMALWVKLKFVGENNGDLIWKLSDFGQKAGNTYGNQRSPGASRISTSGDRYDEGYEAGKEYCKNNPAGCGISTGGGYTQADLDAKYKEGYNAGAGSCSNGSSSSATISATLDLHIPQLNYNTAFGVMVLWADFKYVGESNGELLWKLSDFGQK